MSRHSGATETSPLQRRLEASTRPGSWPGACCRTRSWRRVRVLERANRAGRCLPTHRGRLFRRHRKRKVLAVQRRQRRRNRDAAARRPTTSEPLAGIWGAEGSGPLLDWLGGRTSRHHSAAVPDSPTRPTRADPAGPAGLRLHRGRQPARSCSGWWDRWTSWCGSWIRRSTQMPRCTTTSWPAGLARGRHPRGAEPDRPARPRRPAGAGLPQGDPGPGRPGQGTGPGRLGADGAGVDKVRGAIRDVVMQRVAPSKRLAADVAGLPRGFPRPPGRARPAASRRTPGRGSPGSCDGRQRALVVERWHGPPAGIGAADGWP